MTDSACHEPGNGRAACIQIDRIDALEVAHGEIARDISTTRQIATRTLDEVVALRGEMRESEARRDRECDIRHKAVDRRLDRIEDHDDTLDASSAVTYSEAALRTRYEELKRELIAATKDARDASGRVEIERAKTRRAMWATLGTGVVAIAGVIAAALQALMGE